MQHVRRTIGSRHSANREPLVGHTCQNSRADPGAEPDPPSARNHRMRVLTQRTRAAGDARRKRHGREPP
eukprot:7411294-Pyramimonas_sp.AAC.1